MSDFAGPQVRLFFTALQFFTRLPIPRRIGFDPAWLSPSLRFFPLVGWVIGLITATVYLTAQCFWTPAVAVVLSTIAGIWSTGAFHEDGFADVCDGFGGGMTPERVLEIMRDSRIGAYGAIGIGMLLLLKCSVLGAMPVAATAFAILLAHPLSRLASCSVIWGMQYVREDGKAKVIATQLRHGEFCFALGSVFLPMILVLYYSCTVATTGTAVLPLLSCRIPLPAMALMAGMFMMCPMLWFLVRLFKRRIGGYTGDCLGTVQQLTEVMFYLGCSGALCVYS